MGYSIIFQTKFVKLNDGRILHMERSGCNNDDEGRKKDLFNHCKIYTPEELEAYISKWENETSDYDGYDLKIGSRYVKWIEYGKHMRRMLKKATNWDESNSCSYIADSIDLHFQNGDIRRDVDVEEASKIIDDDWSGSKGILSGWRINRHRTSDIEEIVTRMDDGDTVEIFSYKRAA